MSDPTQEDAYEEPSRRTAAHEAVDVVVCGGGPAGIAAAISAARAGARVRLIELHGCLGGVWTAGLLSWIIDAANKRGLVAEIIERLVDAGGKPAGGKEGVYDPETMKLVLERMAVENGVRVRLHTRVVNALRQDRRIIAAVTESASGREAWPAACFVDATGNGDLAALAGAGFDLGRPSDGKTQPMTLMALLAATVTDGLEPCVIRDGADGQAQDDAKHRLKDRLRDAGCEPSYARPTLFEIHDGLYALMANHEYGRSGLDADDLTAATLHARAEVHRVVAAMNRAGGPLSDLRVVATAEQIGIREARRIHGRRRVAVEDAIAGTTHAPSACRVTFGVDVHSVDPEAGKAYDNAGVRTQPYDIHPDALVARDLDNLYLAGRCISGDFLAHASYRVTGNAVALGETAGRLAATEITVA